MTDDAYGTTTAIGDLNAAQRHELASRLQAEGVDVRFDGDRIRFDAAYDARVESVLAGVRAAGAGPTGAPGDAPTSPAPGYATPAAYAAPPGPMPGYAPTQQYGYGVPAYGYYAPAPQTNSNAILSLVMAILAFAVCPVIPAIVGIIFGKKAQDEIAMSGGTQTGEGLAKAGIIVSWVNIGVFGAFILIYVAIIMVALVVGTAA